jgi:ATP adenylyltransferase
MDKLWAPWRIEYVGKPQEEGCIFCEKPKQNRDRENLIVKRGETVFVMLNAFPYSNGHLMVAPYRHVAAPHELTDEETLEIMRTASDMQLVLRETHNARGFNMGINLGKCAGAGIEDHIHVHVVPRWEGDTNFMPILSDTKVICEALTSSYEKLLEELERW